MTAIIERVRRLPIGVSWAAVMIFGWLVGIGIHMPFWLLAFAQVAPPRLLASGLVGSSSEYRIPVQNIVIPRPLIGHGAPLDLLGFAFQVLIPLAVIGVGQWIVLRGRSSISPAWIPTTIATMFVAEMLVGFGGQMYLEVMLVPALLGGLLVGGAQCLFLRSSLQVKPWIWILTVTTAWTLGSLATLILPYPLADLRALRDMSTEQMTELFAEASRQAAVRGELSSLLRGVVIAICTGAALQRFVGRKPQA